MGKGNDELRIDSHKLIYHPQRVGEWLNGENIYPLTVEVSPSGACNYRCKFCAFDYLNYETNFLDKSIMFKTIQEMSQNGVKSVVVCGEGEPLLNKDTPDIIKFSSKNKVDVGMSTNGLLLKKEISEYCLDSLKWVRVSLNAGTEETHREIHKSNIGDFQTIIGNLEYAVEIKKSKNLNTTIGVQLLLIPDNYDEVISLARILKNIGVDYFTVKPFSKHPLSGSEIDENFNYDDFLEFEEILNSLTTKDYQIIFRTNSMRKLKTRRYYDRCLGLPFWTYIDAKANVWACISYIGNEEFLYGNLKEETFKEIWEGKKRKQVLEKVRNLDVNSCRELCRLDEINSYLFQLKNPNDHVNFI